MSIDIRLVNPYIRVARPSILLKGSELDRRVIYDYELVYVESGVFTLKYNETDYTVTPGSILFFRPGIPHSFRDLLTDISQPHIHFDIFYSPRSTQTPVSYKDICDFSLHEHKLLQSDVFEDYPQNPFITFSNKQQFFNVFYSIVNNTDKDSDLIRKAKMIQILSMLIADNFSSSISVSEPDYNVACQIKDFFDSGQGLLANLDELEKQFSYSKFYLEREFRKNYGTSIISYRNNKRMELAEKMLENNTVSFVSESLGFSSVYAFSRAFKNYFNVSPSKYSEYKQIIKTL